LKIAFVGLPGSGKSTVGRQLARRLQFPFFDSDHVIEQQLGCSIRDYFEREGEKRFLWERRKTRFRCARHAHRPHPGKEAKRYQIKEIGEWLKASGVKQS
jgi:shikimate kinase